MNVPRPLAVLTDRDLDNQGMHGRSTMRQGAQPSVPPRRQLRVPALSPARRRLLALKTRLLHVWLAYKRLTELSFPRRFPIVQFPNLPLIIGFAAGFVAMFLHGSPHSYAQAVSYLGMTIWAYEELVSGVNWFRHLLGLAYGLIMIIRVAHAIHP